MPDPDDMAVCEAPHPPWHQLNLRVADEYTGARRLASVMGDAETDGLIDSWFFIRKGQWRLRFRPARADVAAEVHAVVKDRLTDLRDADDLADSRGVIYEPETYAFGGPLGMATTHRLWHADSCHLTTYLASHAPSVGNPGPDRRRETSVLLLSSMLRAAGLDWYEQGDVWAHLATEHRPLDPVTSSHRSERLTDQMRQLMTADTTPTNLTTNRALASARLWISAFADAGRDLAKHAWHGELTRGLRRVLGHQFIFHWNRLGIPLNQQALLAATGRAAVLG